jgi:hypothetical protein
VAVGASETIRAGLALIVTVPLDAVTVTGNCAAALAAGLDAVLAGGVLLADEVVLDEQPARAAATATATAAAVDIVERGRRRPGLGPGGAVTVAGQRRNGLVTSPALLPGALPGNLARYRGGPAVSLMLLVER